MKFGKILKAKLNMGLAYFDNHKFATRYNGSYDDIKKGQFYSGGFEYYKLSNLSFGLNLIFDKSNAEYVPQDYPTNKFNVYVTGYVSELAIKFYKTINNRIFYFGVGQNFVYSRLKHEGYYGFQPPTSLGDHLVFKYDAYGFGLSALYGLTLRMNKYYSIEIDGGYRYLPTEDLHFLYGESSNVFIHYPGYIPANLDFSGPFIAIGVARSF